MSDVMNTYRKPDGYTIQATEKAFQLFYKKQGFVPVKEEENAGSGERPVKTEADGQEEPEENNSTEASGESTLTETPEESTSIEMPEESTSIETPEENGWEPEAAKPSAKRKKAAGKEPTEKNADSVSEQPAG